MELLSLLQSLTAPAGPSGFETEAVSAAQYLLTPLVDKAYTDVTGNLIGVRYGSSTGDKPRVLLDAHLDEIGVIVTGHRNGFLQFAPLGGLEPVFKNV